MLLTRKIDIIYMLHTTGKRLRIVDSIRGNETHVFKKEQRVQCLRHRCYPRLVEIVGVQ